MNAQAPKPYVVATFFSDGQMMHLQTGVQAAGTEAHATALAVSVYYLNGGKLPLHSAHAYMLTRETLQVAMELLDEAEKTPPKIVKLVPTGEPA